jgi:hypothetical protein
MLFSHLLKCLLTDSIHENNDYLRRYCNGSTEKKDVENESTAAEGGEPL